MAFHDGDGDGYGGALAAPGACGGALVGRGGDCDDTDADVFPGAPERCDGRDEDCDGAVDEEPSDAPVWYPDEDEDGWGDDRRPLIACEAPFGAIALAGDCDDTRDAAHPGAPEVCNDLDDDCDGAVDLPVPADAPAWFPDGDGDGWGAPEPPVPSCAAPEGHVTTTTDCDDAEFAIHPEAVETCDGRDEDCDGATDEDDDPDPLFFLDADGDGYGQAAVLPCEGVPVAGGAGDCDDADPRVNPSAVEICEDGIDNDCDHSAGACGPAGTVSLEGDGALTILHDGSLSFGSDVRSPGDVTGDGFPDLIANSSLTTADGVVILHGGPRPPLGRLLELTWREGNHRRLASGSGDLDGDGVADVALGRDWSDWEPSAIVISGGSSVASGAPFVRLFGASYGGPSARGLQPPLVADFDGDGHADLAVQAPDKLVVMYGPLSAGDVSLDSVPTYVHGDDGGPLAGDPGDLDGDGTMDIPLRPSPSQFCVTTPNRSGASFEDSGYCVNSGYGYVPTSGGDNDGDGYDDLLWIPVGSGEEFRLYRGGPPSELTADWEPTATIFADTATPTYMMFAESTRWVGSVTGSATDAFVVPAWVGTVDQTFHVQNSVGLLFTHPISGSVEVSEAAWLVTESAVDLLGFSGYAEERISVAGADLDLDGYTDVAMGANLAVMGPDYGAVYLLYGHGL